MNTADSNESAPFQFFHDLLTPQSVSWDKDRTSAKIALTPVDYQLLLSQINELKNKSDFYGNITDATQFLFGKKRETEGNGGLHSYRGYLLTEPEQVIGILQRLLKIGINRRESGKRLDFKMYLPHDLSPRPRFSYQINTKSPLAGKNMVKIITPQYGFTTTPHEASFVLYGDSPDEITDIFDNLLQLQWEKIEKIELKDGNI